MISIIAGISLIMIFTTIGAAYMSEVSEGPIMSMSEKCDIMNQYLGIAEGLRVDYIQDTIDKNCS